MYSITLSGYVAILDLDSQQIVFHIRNGVRGLNIPVVVYEEDGEWYMKDATTDRNIEVAVIVITNWD